VLVVGLCTGLVAYYGGALPGRGIAARTELSYVPADVTAVAFADVRRIMDSAFRQKLREVLPTGAEKDRLLENTGIDIEHDIDTVLAGLTGSDARGAVVLMTGRFDRGRIEALAIQHGARQEQYAGRALLVGLSGTEPSDGNVTGQMPSIAFLNEGLLALGDATAIRRAIDVGAGGQSVASNADMMRFITAADDSGHAWLVGRGQSLVGRPEVPSQLRGQLEGLQWVSVSANVDQDVRGLIRAEARDDASAEELRTVVAGAISAAKMFSEQDGRLATALSSVQASGSGRNVELSFEVPAGLLDLLKAGAQRRDVPTPAP
jgi:hypothetical protein